MRREFGLLRDPVSGRSPYLVFSPVPELLAAMWSAQYETMLVGRVPRADKEMIAASISALNACPFCVDAHSALSRSAGAGALPHPLSDASLNAITDPRRRALVRWALATRSPQSPLLDDPPFGEHDAPEIIGTAIAFHYVNRIVSVFLGDEPIFPGGRARRLAERLVGLYARGALRRSREPGRTLGIFGPAADAQELDLQWAAGSPHIAASVAQMDRAVVSAADVVLPVEVRALVVDAVEGWDGTDPVLSRIWTDRFLAQLDERYQPLLRLCLLVAIAPYQVSDEDITAFRALRPSDRELVIACSWSAFTAAKRIGRWLVTTSEERAK